MLKSLAGTSQATRNGMRLAAHWIQDAVTWNKATRRRSNTEAGEELGVKVVEGLQ